MSQPTHHICLAGHTLTAKNALETAFTTYLKSLNGKLILTADLNALQIEIIAKSVALNAEFKRCKPLKIDFWRARSHTSYKIGGFYTVNFTIHDAFIDEPQKKYKIPELRIEIYAKNDEEFEQKKQRLLDRNTHYNTGGRNFKEPAIIKDL